MIIICIKPQVDSSFEGARKNTSEEYQAGERFAVQRHEDNLRLGTEVRYYSKKDQIGRNSIKVGKLFNYC